MRHGLIQMLVDARRSRRAVAACNVYTLDQAAGVLDAAEAAERSIVLQVHPGGLGTSIWPLVAGLIVLAERAAVPVAVHLDHCSDVETMRAGAAAGVEVRQLQRG